MGIACLVASSRSALACDERWRGPAGEIRQHWNARDGSLVARVWSARKPWAQNEQLETDACGAHTELSRLFGYLWAGHIVLMGEVHDNGEHHIVQAQFAKSLARREIDASPVPYAVFEQIRADQQPALDRFADFNARARRLGTTGDLLAFLDWDKSPWSKMADYRPLFDAVVNARFPILPGDPPRDIIRKAAKEGIAAAVSPEERTRLGLNTPLGDAQDAASLAEIDGSHCGMIPKAAQPNMAQAQRFRDAHMADALLKAAELHGSAVLFAGNGHVRTDRGVPWYIRQRAPERPVDSVMLIEVIEGQTDPESYVPRDPDGHPATDFIIFTPPAKRDKDPCETMKKPEPK